MYGKELLIIHVYMDFMSPLVFFNLKEQQIQLCSDIDMQMHLQEVYMYQHIVNKHLTLSYAKQAS